MDTVVVEGGCGNDGVQREKGMGVRGEREWGGCERGGDQRAVTIEGSSGGTGVYGGNIVCGKEERE